MKVSNGSDITVDCKTEGVGASLKRMRELRELTQEEVAHRLRLQHSIIELMESGAFPGNLPEIFAKGYLKSYARLLQFSESDVLHMLASIRFQSPLYNATHFNDQQEDGSSSHATYLLTGLIVLIMIALLIIWLEPTFYEMIIKWIHFLK